MTRKKAQFGLDTLMGYLLFALFLIFTMMALTLSGCGSNKNKIERGISVDTGRIAALRASEQLSAYLATEIPEKEALYIRIDEAKERAGEKTDFDKKKVKEFLDKHPEVYVNKTYAGFISSLYAYGGEKNVRDVFDAVTKALFYRPLFSKSKRDVNDGRLDRFYYSPVISVKYGLHEKNPYGVGELYSGLSSSHDLVYAFRDLPTQDKRGVTVRFMLEDAYEKSSEPLP